MLIENYMLITLVLLPTTISIKELHADHTSIVAHLRFTL